MTSILRTAARAAILICTLGASIAIADAPDPKAIEAAKKHYATGEQLFGSNHYKGAVEEFKEAYRLTRNPLLLYNIGFVYDKLEDSALAIHYYEKFISDAPDNAKTHAQREQVIPRIAELKKQAPSEEAETPAEPPKKPEKGSKTKGTATATAEKFTHEVIEDAPPGKPIDVAVVVPDGVDWTLTLFYRAAGEDSFRNTKMKARMAEVVGRIPGNVVRGNSIHYYIEARDTNGKVVSSSGKAGSPNIVMLDASAKSHYYVDGKPAAPEQDAERPPGLAKAQADNDGGPTPEGDQAPASPVDHPSHGLTTWKWVATGGGVALLGAAVSFYLVSHSYANTMSGEAYASNHECGTPPCRVYNDSRSGLQSTGQMFQTLSYVGWAMGGVSAVTAGILWYVDAKRHKHAQENKVDATPVVGQSFIGGSAVVRF